MALTNVHFSYHTAVKYSRLTRSTLSGWFRPTRGGPPNARIPPFPIQSCAPARRRPGRRRRHHRLRQRQHAVRRQHRRHHTGRDHDAAGTSAAGASAPATELPAAELSLVAYSTPQQAYEKIIEAFNATPQGKNITLHQVVRRLGRPEPGGRRRARGRLRRLLARARRHPPRQGGPGRRGLEQGPVRRQRDRLRRRAGRAQGQPEEHHRLGRPHQARRRGDHAPTRSPPVAPAGT